MTSIFVLLVALTTADGRIITGRAGPFPDRPACERTAATERASLQQQGAVAVGMACVPLSVPTQLLQPKTPQRRGPEA